MQPSRLYYLLLYAVTNMHIIAAKTMYSSNVNYILVKTE